jgi:hypothetical protein
MEYDSTEIVEKKNDSFYGFTIDNREEIDSLEIYQRIMDGNNSTQLINNKPDFIKEGNVIYVPEEAGQDAIWYVSKIKSSYLDEPTFNEMNYRILEIVNVNNGETKELGCNENDIINIEDRYKYISRKEDTYHNSPMHVSRHMERERTGELTYKIISDTILCEASDIQEEIIHVMI